VEALRLGPILEQPSATLSTSSTGLTRASPRAPRAPPPARRRFTLACADAPLMPQQYTSQSGVLPEALLAACNGASLALLRLRPLAIAPSALPSASSPRASAAAGLGIGAEPGIGPAAARLPSALLPALVETARGGSQVRTH
jgi:hypothetical protein